MPKHMILIINLKMWIEETFNFLSSLGKHVSAYAEEATCYKTAGDTSSSLVKVYEHVVPFSPRGLTLSKVLLNMGLILPKKYKIKL